MEYYWIIGLIIRGVFSWLLHDDAQKRGMNRHAWGIGAFFFPFFLAIVYLIVRKPRVELKTEK